jgi:hypothetical protein
MSPPAAVGAFGVVREVTLGASYVTTPIRVPTMAETVRNMPVLVPMPAALWQMTDVSDFQLLRMHTVEPTCTVGTTEEFPPKPDPHTVNCAPPVAGEFASTNQVASAAS